MERWTCPSCRREFGKVNQGHMCNPGLTLEEYFAEAQPWERPIYDAVADHVTNLSDVIIDPISIGILFKHGPVFCELRARKKWTALGFSLRRPLTSGRLSRKVVDYQGKYFHVVNVDHADQIDDDIRGWLTEAYYAAVGAAVPSPVDETDDGMVPLDIDDPFAD